MAPLETAISDLRQLLSSDASTAEWRWHVRLRLSAVRDALADPQTLRADAWLAARQGTSDRHRLQLLARVSALASGVLERLDLETIRGEADAAAGRPGAPRAAGARPGLRLGVAGARRLGVAARAAGQRGRDSNPRLISLPATAFKAVPIGHSGTPPRSLRTGLGV